MPALREILTLHASLLVLDAASTRVQVGWLEAGGHVRWASYDEEAGTGLFRALSHLGIDPDRVESFAFCEGPGSLLGIRTAAMVLRTWTALRPRPVFAYQSLALLAHALRRGNVRIIADARRDTWHCTPVAPDGTVGPLQRIATAGLTGPVVMPAAFRHWSAMPSGPVESIDYNVAELFARTGQLDLFRETAEPDAYLHDEPAYATWTPRVHQAPPAP